MVKKTLVLLDFQNTRSRRLFGTTRVETHIEMRVMSRHVLLISGLSNRVGWIGSVLLTSGQPTDGGDPLLYDRDARSSTIGSMISLDPLPALQ